MDQMIKGLSKEDLETWNRFVEKLKESPVHPPPGIIYGEGAPSRRLDLHGMTIHDAWIALRDFVEMHRAHGSKDAVVVTGRSGRIYHEFTEWCRKLDGVRGYEPMPTRSGKVGSYRIKIKSR